MAAASASGLSRDALRNEGRRLRGKIISWKTNHGFGFVRPEDGSEDIFVHKESLAPGQRQLPEGTVVEFTAQMEKGKNKLRAEKVVAIVDGGGGGGAKIYKSSQVKRPSSSDEPSSGGGGSGSRTSSSSTAAATAGGMRKRVRTSSALAGECVGDPTCACKGHASVDPASGRTLLMLAAWKGKVADINAVLLNPKIPPNHIFSVDNNCKSAFHYAAARTAFKGGLTALLRGPISRTPAAAANAAAAAGKSSSNVFAAALRRKAKLAKDSEMLQALRAFNAGGHAPIHCAARVGSVAGLTELLLYDPTLRSFMDKSGLAPIHIATWEGNWAAVKLLLDHGEDITKACKNNGMTVFDIATSEEGKNRDDRRRLLQELQSYAIAMVQKQQLRQSRQNSSSVGASSSSSSSSSGGGGGGSGRVRSGSSGGSGNGAGGSGGSRSRNGRISGRPAGGSSSSNNSSNNSSNDIGNSAGCARKARSNITKELGDWVCPRCNNINFQRRNACNIPTCREPKPPDVGDGGGGGGGGSAAHVPRNPKLMRADSSDPFPLGPPPLGPPPGILRAPSPDDSRTAILGPPPGDPRIRGAAPYRDPRATVQRSSTRSVSPSSPNSRSRSSSNRAGAGRIECRSNVDGSNAGLMGATMPRAVTTASSTSSPSSATHPAAVGVGKKALLPPPKTSPPSVWYRAQSPTLPAVACSKCAGMQAELASLQSLLKEKTAECEQKDDYIKNCTEILKGADLDIELATRVAVNRKKEKARWAKSDQAQTELIARLEQQILDLGGGE